MARIKSLLTRQAVRFGTWMITPKTVKGGVGRFVLGLMMVSAPFQMVSRPPESSSRQPIATQPQSSPVVVASPVQSPALEPTLYTATTQVNTLDGDRVPQPSEVKINNGVFTVSVPFFAVREQTMVYEFDFNSKTMRQYCNNCLSQLKREDASVVPMNVDSVTPDSFSATPKEMADELGTRDFYIIRLTGDVKPPASIWVKSADKSGTVASTPQPPKDTTASSIVVTPPTQPDQAIAASRDGKNALVFAPPSNCRSAASKNAAVVKVFDQQTYISVNVNTRTADGWYVESSGCAIHESQVKLLGGSNSTPEPIAAPAPEPVQQAEPTNTMPSFSNCSEARASGYSNFATTPGSRFDRDGDGIGCES
jgi:Excalibur calcium-binding domain